MFPDVSPLRHSSPPRTTPEVHLAGLARARQRVGVHVRQRQHLAGAGVLHHARHQAVGVEGDLVHALILSGGRDCRPLRTLKYSHGVPRSRILGGAVLGADRTPAWRRRPPPAPGAGTAPTGDQRRRGRNGRLHRAVARRLRRRAAEVTRLGRWRAATLACWRSAAPWRARAPRRSRGWAGESGTDRGGRAPGAPRRLRGIQARSVLVRPEHIGTVDRDTRSPAPRERWSTWPARARATTWRPPSTRQTCRA